MSKLVNGKIPPHTICPFKSSCVYSSHCWHKGEKHTVPFSCASARAFDLVDTKTHSPGPWESGTAFIAPQSDRCLTIRGKKGEAIAFVNIWVDEPSEGYFNLFLITAAPDGLKAAVMAYLHILKTPHDRLRVQGQAVLCALRDYIAKATGRSEEEVQNDFEEMVLMEKEKGK